MRLDANHFAKSTSRTGRKMAGMRRRCRRYEERLVRMPSEKYISKILKCRNVVRRLLRNEREDIETFKEVVHGLRERCERLCEEAEPALRFGTPSVSNTNCIVNAGDGEGDDKLYCKCNQPAFRNMIACESVDCKTGWFHCECVNVVGAPKASWVCPECRKKTVLAK